MTTCDATDETNPTETAPATVLVVEDESVVRDVVRVFLEYAGYAVLEAADGESAVSLAERHAGAIDLLITDMRLPGMDGRAVAALLLERRPRIEVLFISGYFDDSLPETPERDRRLEKPFTQPELTGSVGRLLGEWAACGPGSPLPGQTGEPGGG